MADITLTIDARGRVATIAERVRDTRGLLESIGAQVLSTAQGSFRAQRLGRDRWPGRMVPNVAGIVGDLNAGRNPPARRFQPRPALVDTGRLRQSLTMRVRRNVVEVGTVLQYAGLQQFGGVTQVRLRSAGRKRLVELLRKRRDLRQSLGWLFARPSFTVRVRPRRFVGITPEDRGQIVELVEDYISGEG